METKHVLITISITGWHYRTFIVGTLDFHYAAASTKSSVPALSKFHEISFYKKDFDLTILVFFEI